MLDSIPSRTVIQAQNLSIGYKNKNVDIKFVQQKLNFELHFGELTCLIGPNGAGKSTLLRTICGAQPTIEGNVFIQGKDIKRYKATQFSKVVSLVLTERINAGGLRVGELVGLGRQPYTGFFGRLDKKDGEIIDQSLKDVGMIAKKDNFFADLSDGEKQKVMIAKALTQQTAVIILDEPTSFLDILSRIEIISLLRDLAKKQNKAILLSTHDLEQAIIYADKLWLLSTSNGMVCGTPEDLILNNELDHLFLHQSISFDKVNGNFRHKNNLLKPIKLSGDKEIVIWLDNLLHRHGFRKMNKDENSDIEIIGNSSKQLLLKSGPDKTVTFHSFGELDGFFSQKDQITT